MVIDWLGFVVLFACFCNLFFNSYSFLISTRKSCEPSLFPLYLDNFYSIRASVGVFVIFVTQHINVTLRRATNQETP